MPGDDTLGAMRKNFNVTALIIGHQQKARIPEFNEAWRRYVNACAMGGWRPRLVGTVIPDIPRSEFSPQAKVWSVDMGAKPMVYPLPSTTSPRLSRYIQNENLKRHIMGLRREGEKVVCLHIPNRGNEPLAVAVELAERGVEVVTLPIEEFWILRQMAKA